MTVEIDLDQVEDMENTLLEFATEITTLRAQVAVNLKDAERYRFLRDQALDNKGMGLVVFVEINQLDHIHDSNEIDAAIDKAMAE